MDTSTKIFGGRLQRHYVSTVNPADTTRTSITARVSAYSLRAIWWTATAPTCWPPRPSQTVAHDTIQPTQASFFPLCTHAGNHVLKLWRLLMYLVLQNHEDRQQQVHIGGEQR